MLPRAQAEAWLGKSAPKGGQKHPSTGLLDRHSVLRTTMADRDPKGRLSDWFRQWRVPLRRFLIGRGGVPDSDLDDLAQEVFLRLMRYERTELIEHPQAYLFKVASNVAAEWAIRGRSVRIRESQWGIEVPADEVEHALLTLTPQQRAVLRLQFYEGLSRIEIAERLGTSERSVKRILMKSYERLRGQLNPDLLRGITNGRE
jgi:RNA polymerase sigma factor (sigma-70 family)